MNSVFKVIAALFVFLTAMVIVIFPSAVQADQAGDSVPNTQSQVCPENNCKPYDPRFSGIERVGLFVHIPSPYEHAIECHERIDECLKKRGSKEFPEKNAAISQRWIDNYNVFPKDLHPENLAALLKPQIEQEIMPLVQYQEGCKKPDIVLDKSQIYELQKDPKALIVDVRVRVFDHLAPQTAVLYLTVHRAEVAVRDNFLHMMTISLDLPKETITARVKDFARYEVMTTCKMSQTGSFQ